MAYRSIILGAGADARPWLERTREAAARWAPGLAILGAVANLLVQGFEFPNYNNVYHVPIVLRYAQSAEGPHDAFHQTLTNFTSVLWPLLSWVATEDNISALFFGVYAANRIALVVLLYLIARELLPTRRDTVAVAVSAIVLLWWAAWPLSPLGGNDLFVRALSQTQLTVTALVGCLWLMLRRRWLATAVCLGLAFNINAFMALWGGVIAFAVYLRMNRSAPRAAVMRELALLGAAAAVTALPTVIWIASTLGSGPPAAPFDYRAYIADFYPRHNLLAGNWVGVLIAAMIAWIVWTYIRDERLFASARHREIVATSFMGLCAILLAGMTMPYLVNSRLLYCLFPLRMDGYLIAPLMIVLVAAALARAHAAADDAAFWSEALMVAAFANGNLPLALFASTCRGAERTGKLAALLFLPIAAAFVAASGTVPIYYRSNIIGSLAICLGQAAAVAMLARSRRLPLAYVAALGGLIVPALLPAPLGPWGALAAFLYVGAAASLTGVAQSLRWVRAPVRFPAMLARPAHLARVWAGPAILAAGLLAGGLRTLAAGTFNHLPESIRANIEAQVWLRHHSEPDEVVLALDVDDFSTLSRRPVWIDPGMGSAVMWSPWYYTTWHTRMAEIGRLQTIDEAIAYARAHRIAYIVMSRAYAARSGTNPADPAIIYANPDYLILSAAGARPEFNRRRR